ncbi:MAG: DJ-1/PfpI family protein [Candidatus Thorarchaeota archaeon]
MKYVKVTKVPQKDAPWLVGILVFEQAEILDFCGPYEVLSVTRFLNEENQRTEDSPFEVKLISETGDVVRCRGGLKVVADFNFDNNPKFDLILVPGGWGTRKEVQNPVLIKWLKNQQQDTQLVVSVCTGSFLLAEAGLLDGFEATTHWASIERMKKAYPKVQVIEGKRFIFTGQGRILTSAGIAAGIDMSLFLVSELVGEKVAQKTAHHMEYPWK